MTDKTKKIVKRAAAGTAKTTAGRARVFRDKTKYTRKNKKEDDHG
jgi:hypothetical protein